jgi:hypothetical protein
MYRPPNVAILLRDKIDYVYAEMVRRVDDQMRAVGYDSRSKDTKILLGSSDPKMTVLKHYGSPSFCAAMPNHSKSNRFISSMK